jgi:UDP-N-acetylglucosamine 1-carboxyvinyltransferase
VRISGAKNAALKALAASLLTNEEVVLRNVPMIADVTSMADLLRALGATVQIDSSRDTVTVRAIQITTTEAPAALFKATRASVVVTGPMLARAGSISFAMPGGDQIGKRPIDMHLRGFERMGATIEHTATGITASADGLKGARIYMDYPSHTGTEAVLMASTLAVGTSVIVNASMEPEIVWLGSMLNRMGARIAGWAPPSSPSKALSDSTASPSSLFPTVWKQQPMPLPPSSPVVKSLSTAFMNRICSPSRRNCAKPAPMSGQVRPDAGPRWYHASIRRHSNPPVSRISHRFQSTFVPLLTQATGVATVHERVYEDRLRYTDELNKMGADIRVRRFGDNGEFLATTAEVHGPTPLHGARVLSLDIRSAVSLVLAGLVAEGETELLEVHHIDRGYARFVEKLTDLGAVLVDTAPIAST